MPAQITFRCGWCHSKDQTADIIHHNRYTVRSLDNRETERPYITVVCRRCKKSSSVFTRFRPDVPAHLKRHVQRFDGSAWGIFGENGDVSSALILKKQQPSAQSGIDEAIPLSVRDALLDADDARSDRARCQAYRSAVEFALREAGVAERPGTPLGGMLREARDNFALPETLLDLCNQVKAFGNWGLHWAETDIEPRDAEVAKKITLAILEYMFVLPKLVEEAQARVAEAQANHTNDNGASSQ